MAKMTQFYRGIDLYQKLDRRKWVSIRQFLFM